MMPKRIDFIVVEDEEAIRREYETLSKEFEDLFLIGTTNNSDTGIEMVKEYHPAAIVLDLELHKGYGNGISFLKDLGELNLTEKPYVLVVTNNISQVTHNIARNLGADFVMTKNQHDYSVRMVLGTITSFIDIGFAGENTAADHSAAAKLKAGLEYSQSLKSKISVELDLIGIGPKLKGRMYLQDAIEITCEKRTSNLSAIIAKKYSKTDASVERAMQTAINHAWRNTDIETLEKYYTAYISPKKGVPTITEFIYYYADKIKKNI